jgi:Ser/Thr protein kinase RdoA (MazF antagonist)
VLKADWEKTGEIVSVPDGVTRAMAAQGLPGAQLQSYSLIAGGCANLNAKLCFDGRDKPVILRIYIRDPSAAARESALSKLVAPDVPVPQFLYIGECEGYSFALVEFLEGMTLRDLLLDKSEDPLCAVHDAGRICAAFQKHRFASPGSFEGDLRVKSDKEPPDFVKFAEECLAHPFTQQQFGAAKSRRLLRLLEESRASLPDNKQSFLVHGDYDPANIFVKRDGAGWTVSGILDWEFAASGAWLWDVSNMLRYAHLLPPTYEGAFREGLQGGGAKLPPDWRTTYRLMNITSLLWLLLKGKDGDRPRMCADICKLTDHIADELEKPKAAAI